MQATRQLLSAGRWHLQHGPMDVIVQAEGDALAVAAAHARAWATSRYSSESAGRTRASITSSSSVSSAIRSRYTPSGSRGGP